MNPRIRPIDVSAALFCALASAPAAAQHVDGVTVSSAAAEPGSFDVPAISADGRFVAFSSFCSSLVDGDTNDWIDTFVYDRFAGTIERVDVDSNGNEGRDTVYDLPDGPPSISADGRFVAFQSDYPNLVANDTNGATDVFVRDRLDGTTERVSVDSDGIEGGAGGRQLAISADGRYVAFSSESTNLIASGTNGKSHIFIHDRATGETTRVSVDSSGQEADGNCLTPALSADGRIVAFVSFATNLGGDVSTTGINVFLHDRATATTELVSVSSTGTDGDRWSSGPSLSSDGRFVAFSSFATNLVTDDRNDAADCFVRDRVLATIERVSVDSNGAEANGQSNSATISADGRSVAFWSEATNLVAGDDAQPGNVFLRDRGMGTTQCLSVDPAGGQANGGSGPPALSADGRFVAFPSSASNLVPGDTNDVGDLFVAGPWLTLEAEPRALDVGATLTLTHVRGAASGLVLLVAVDVDGAALFQPMLFDTCDADGLWSFATVVPACVSGSTWTVRTYGFVATGKVAASNDVVVTFR